MSHSFLWNLHRAECNSVEGSGECTSALDAIRVRLHDTTCNTELLVLIMHQILR